MELEIQVRHPRKKEKLQDFVSDLDQQTKKMSDNRVLSFCVYVPVWKKKYHRPAKGLLI